MLSTADGQYQAQQAITGTTVAAVRKLWSGLGDDFSQQWDDGASAQIQTVLQAGRSAAVVTALPYTAAALAEQGESFDADGQVDSTAFVRSAPSGVPVDAVVSAPIIEAKLLVGQGMSGREALQRAGSKMVGIALTMLADTRRSVYQADITQRPRVAGYVRKLNPPSCSRCAILAGRFYRWNAGFQRHPRCDCQHVPVRSAEAAKGLTTDPYEYFNSLSPEDQEKIFGNNQAKAIRDGADIYRVENVRMRGLSTANGTGPNKWKSTMTVEDIYKTAGNDREAAIGLLKQQGYIKGPLALRQQVERYASGISRPVQSGSNRARVLAARATGKRDPLDRATMTAAERRLYDSWYRYKYAETFQSAASSIGASSTTRFELPRALRPGQIDALETAYVRQLNVAFTAANDAERAQLVALAQLLEGGASLPTRVLTDRLNWRP